MSAPNIQQIIDAAFDEQIAQDAAALAAMQAAHDAALSAAHAETATAQQALANYQLYVEGNLGPLWDVKWHKQDYRGFPLDLTGYVETFRSDFDDLSQITNGDGAGPWFSGGPKVHTYFGNSFFDGIDQNPQLYRSDTPGILTMRCMTPDGNVNTSWRTGIIQTMQSDGRGFSQAKGVFEARMKMPSPPANGFWGAFWLLSAADYHPEITDHLIEIDVFENYGGQPTATVAGAVDKGIHTTVHVKPRRVPLPGEFPDRVSQALYSDPQSVFDTDPATGGASTTHTYPANVALFDGQFHTYTVVIDDDWVTAYFDGKSIGRVWNKNGMFSTPLYMLVNQTLKRPSNSAALVSPLDMYIDYVRALARA